MRYAFFPLLLSKVLRLPRKSGARSYKVLRLSGKIILANLQIWCSKMQPLSGNQHQHLWWTCLLHRACHAKSSLQTLFKCPTPANVFETATKPSRFAHFWQGAESLAPAMQNHIWTLKSGSSMWCFKNLDLEMCFAPPSRHRRALFRHVNFQKRSDTEVFCAFWLRHVLRATTVCIFSLSQLPKVVWDRDRQFFTLLTSKCASRHNGVQFFISHLAKWLIWLRTRRFSEATFRPLETQIMGFGICTLVLNPLEKHNVLRLFYLFAHLHLLSAHSFSSLIFFLLLFSSLTLPTSAFPSLHIVRSLTSKLPSINI